MVKTDIRVDTFMQLEKPDNLADHLFILNKEHLPMPVIKLIKTHYGWQKIHNKCYFKEGQKKKCDNA